jgi:predicted phage tail protein
LSLSKIRLYGELAEFCGCDVFEAEVNSVGQAMSFLIANFKGVAAHVANNQYHVFADDWNLKEDELTLPTGNSEISIVPIVAGSSGNKWFDIIIGVALVWATGGLGAGFGTTSILGISGKYVAQLGVMMVLGGVYQMLNPVDEIPDAEQDPKNSFAFSGLTQTNRAGVCVPLIYGQEIMVGSVLISSSVDTNQVEV